MRQVVQSGILLLSIAMAASALGPAGIIAGDYSGRYRCGNGWHPVKLHIMDDGGGNMRADFTFTDRVPPQSFRLWGKYYATGNVNLQPVRGQARWPQYAMIGRFDAAAH